MGHALLAAGDTAAAIERLSGLSSSAPRDTLSWELGESLPVERLVLARLLQQTGRCEEAIRVASAFDHSQPLIFVTFLPASLALRRDCADALGRNDLVARFGARLEALSRTDLTATVR
jgi:hypothetical protein